MVLLLMFVFFDADLSTNERNNHPEHTRVPFAEVFPRGEPLFTLRLISRQVFPLPAGFV
jgi:hypothetical protein